MRKMKDSGIEWIGEIPENWKIRRIKTLFQLRNEKSFKPLNEVNLISLYTDKGVLQHSDIEYVAGNKASNADGYKCVYEDDIVVNIILCWMGAIGRSAYTGVTSPAYDIYKPCPGTDSRFYHYYFRTKGFNGECFQRGRGIMLMRWRTYAEDFMDIKVCFPSLPEQQQIADYLDSKVSEIDSTISKTRESIEEYKKLKQAIITEAVTKGLNPNAKMKNSGIEWIGEIPEEWECFYLSQIFTPVKNKNIGLIENNLLSLSYGKIIRKNIETTFGLLPENFEGYNIIQENDIVLRLTDLQNDHKSLRVGIAKEKGIITSAYLTLRNQTNKIAKYFYYLLHSFDIAKGFYGMGAGVRQGLNWNEVRSLRMIAPKDISEQQQIADYLDQKCSEIDNLITKKEQLVVELEAYKKSLIYEVVTGKREV